MLKTVIDARWFNNAATNFILYQEKMLPKIIQRFYTADDDGDRDSVEIWFNQDTKTILNIILYRAIQCNQADQM